MNNQVQANAGHNAYLADGVLLNLTQKLSEPVRKGLADHGKWVASAEALELARLANENPPKLRAFDARGDRLDQVEFHPAYHALMRRGIAIGLGGSTWEEDNEENGVRILKIILDLHKRFSGSLQGYVQSFFDFVLDIYSNYGEKVCKIFEALPS